MELESELLRIMNAEELEEALSGKIKSFHGLLTRDVAIRLIAKERGLMRKEDSFFKLSVIPKGEKRVCFLGRVKKVWPVAKYSSGKQSRVIEVEDESGVATLVLWNSDVELGNGLRVNDEIVVKGAYERNGELHLSYSGSLEIERKSLFSELRSLDDGDIVHIRGVVSKLEGMDRFVRDGYTSMGFAFIITDGQSERRCVIIGGMNRSGKLREGDEIIVEGGRVNNSNVEISNDSKILIRRKGEMIIGQIRRVDCIGEKIELDVEGREISLERPSALKLLGVEAAEDVRLSTVVALKKDVLLNNRIAIKFEEKDGQIFLRD